VKKNQIILIIVGVLILVGLVFYFNYWLKQIQPKTGTSVPTEEKTEISQEEAIEIAQEKHPGEVYKVKEEEMVVSKEFHYPIWVISIETEANIIEVSINKKTGEIAFENTYPSGGEKGIFLKPEYEGGEKLQ